MNRIDRKFKELKRENKKAFIAFITAGYPNLKITKRLILAFAKIGVDIIEIGVPFSDPLADGPVIQESSQAALKHKINLQHIFGLVESLRKVTDVPICLMTYYNPVFCFGEKKFVTQASTSGIDGVIIPDLPPEEAKSLTRLAGKSNLDTIFFLAPTSGIERIKLIAQASRGFIYYVSLTGVTGVRRNLASDIVRNLKKIKRITHQPLCVGFGISEPSHIRQIYRIADGVIVGSAIIKKIKEDIDRPDLVKRVADFIRKLKAE